MVFAVNIPTGTPEGIYRANKIVTQEEAMEYFFVVTSGASSILQKSSGEDSDVSAILYHFLFTDKPGRSKERSLLKKLSMTKRCSDASL
jgi:hypothetical protein